MIKETRRKESDKNLEELIELVIPCEAINDTTEKYRNKYEYGPLRYTELHEEEWKVQEENEIGQIELKRYFEEYIGVRIETCENEKYGNVS